MADTPSPTPHQPLIEAEVAGHHLTIVSDGAVRMQRLLALIDASERSLDLIFYTFAADEAGRQVLGALTAAVGRGVRVRTVIDRFGSAKTPAAFFDPLRKAGGSVTFFSRHWRSAYLIRNHQKLVIADETVAMAGGFNIAGPYLSDARPDCWFDLAIEVAGPSVVQMVRWFEAIHHYTVCNDGKLLVLRRLIRHWPVRDAPVSWLVGGPTQRLSPWARAVRRDFARAQRLDMAMAYFSPAQGMLRRIGKIARRGKVRLMAAARSDNAATVGASRLLYGYLLRRGAEIVEYRACRLHMKLIVIDDIVYLGSPNFDMRSLFINVELALRVVDRGFAGQMRALIDAQADDCETITPALHKRRAGWLTRLRWALSWFVVSTVDYTVARRLNFGLADELVSSKEI